MNLLDIIVHYILSCTTGILDENYDSDNEELIIDE